MDPSSADPTSVASFVGVLLASALNWLMTRKAVKDAPKARAAAEESAVAIAQLSGEMKAVAAGVRECRDGQADLTRGLARLEERIERHEAARRGEEPTRPDLPRPRARLRSRP